MAIIGVSGYSNSGKDSVGKIIQELCPKDDWQIKKFAGKLKVIASLLTGISVDKFEDQEFKKTELGPEWTTIDYIKRYAEPFPTDDSIPVEITEVNTPMTVRDFLQKLGTDGLRTGLHTNVWVNALMADYKPEWTTDEGAHDPVQELPNWIITDVRFPNEGIAIKNAGGIVIRVDRPGVKPINDHPSEVGLDGWNFDYKIGNVSDLTALSFTVETILKKLNLL
jgi:hypothetical protein